MHKFVETGRLERRPLQGCTIDFQEFVGRRGRWPVRRLREDIQKVDTRAGRVSGPYKGNSMVRRVGRAGLWPLRMVRSKPRQRGRKRTSHLVDRAVSG